MIGILTHDILEKLSKRIENVIELQNICVNLGLGFQPEELDSAFERFSDIRKASYIFFNEWLKRQYTRQQAYLDLREALRKSDLELLARAIVPTAQGIKNISIFIYSYQCN